MTKPSHLFVLTLQTFIKTYQWLISPLMPVNCRHLPTCSQYACEALKLFGPCKGLWLTIKRIMRCQPWGTSGYDPVPRLSNLEKNKNLSQKSVAELQTARYTSRAKTLQKSN
ncbi:MAG: membrane protein insertion efficiency factor YidD [Pseudomonadota bacterium]|nr:membrane protein insertion efficiency factor YidD [Pseudomonadota bacterium]